MPLNYSSKLNAFGILRILKTLCNKGWHEIGSEAEGSSGAAVQELWAGDESSIFSIFDEISTKKFDFCRYFWTRNSSAENFKQNCPNIWRSKRKKSNFVKLYVAVARGKFWRLFVSNELVSEANNASGK